MGIAVWTGFTKSTERYIVAVGYSSNSAFDNENGTFQWPFFYEKGIIKHSYFGRDLFHWNYPVSSIAFNLWSYAARKIIKWPVFVVANSFFRKVTQKLLNHWLGVNIDRVYNN